MSQGCVTVFIFVALIVSAFDFFDALLQAFLCDDQSAFSVEETMMKKHLLFYLVSLIWECNSQRLRDHPESCANFSLLRSLDPSGPITVLASMPGSGNSWVRHLLQLATGILTGSVYREEITEEFPGNYLGDGSALVIKDHLFQMQTEK